MKTTGVESTMKTTGTDVSNDGKTCMFCSKKFSSSSECASHVDIFHHNENMTIKTDILLGIVNESLKYENRRIDPISQDLPSDFLNGISNRDMLKLRNKMVVTQPGINTRTFKLDSLKGPFSDYESSISDECIKKIDDFTNRTFDREKQLALKKLLDAGDLIKIETSLTNEYSFKVSDAQAYMQRKFPGIILIRNEITAYYNRISKKMIMRGWKHEDNENCHIYDCIIEDKDPIAYAYDMLHYKHEFDLETPSEKYRPNMSHFSLNDAIIGALGSIGAV